MNKLLSLSVLAACALLAAACGKTDQVAKTTTKTQVAAATPAPAALSVVPKPVGSLEAATATGPGVVGDTSQTAALSAPANSNGTTPSTGVIPRPSR